MFVQNCARPEEGELASRSRFSGEKARRTAFEIFLNLVRCLAQWRTLGLDTKRALSVRDIDAPPGNDREEHVSVGQNMQLNGKYARNVIARSFGEAERVHFAA